MMMRYVLLFLHSERSDADRVHSSQDGEEKIPDPPPKEVPSGVLPRLIANLVNRRKQVKSLMKDKSATPSKLLQVGLASR
jgi:DNA polymerase alpha subunit A